MGEKKLKISTGNSGQQKRFNKFATLEVYSWAFLKRTDWARSLAEGSHAYHDAILAQQIDIL